MNIKVKVFEGIRLDEKKKKVPAIGNAPFFTLRLPLQ